MMSGCLLSERSRVFQHADPYTVSGYVNQHVGAHCIRLPSHGWPEASLSHRQFSSLDLCRISYGGRVRVTSPALETIYHLQILLKGHCRWYCRGQEHFFMPGELLLINPDDPVDLTYSADCEKFIVKLPVSLFENTCLEQRWMLPESGIRFSAARHDMRQLDSLATLLMLVCEEAEGAACMPQVAEHYARIVAGKLLALLDNNVQRVVPQARASSFEQVAAYIDQHLTQDIGVEQLMAVARVSERSLYALFERNAGIAPGDYVRQRKLERIHACLLDPACRVRSVTEIALDHGFVHLGRFAEAYRRQFGELPSQTLRRQRPLRGG